MKKCFGHRASKVGDTRVAGDHRGDDGAIDQEADLMGKAAWIFRAGFLGDLTNTAKHDQLMGKRNRPEAVVMLVILADGVDERAPVKAFFGEPCRQKRKDPAEAIDGSGVTGVEPSEEPIPLGDPLPLQNDRDQGVLRPEGFVKRGFGGPGLGNHGIDPDRMDAVTAEQTGCRLDQALARRPR